MVDEDLKSEFEEIKFPPKKRKKLKWLLFLLLFIIIVTSVLFGLVKFGYVELPPDVNHQIKRLIKGSTDMLQMKSTEKVAVAPIILPPEMPLKRKESSKKVRTAEMTGNYFIELGSCSDKKCLNEFSRNIKPAHLPLITRKNVQRTNYYELISESGFLKKRAEEKLRLLNKYNKTNGFPYLVRGKNNKLRISFGQFPQQSNAIRMKSHLEQLYPQIRIRFHIRSRKDRITITKLYVGPFNKSTAEKTKMRLQKNPDFDWINIKHRSMLNAD